jgi:hypothetical protein
MKLFQAGGGHKGAWQFMAKADAKNRLISYAHERDRDLIHFLAEQGGYTKVEVSDELGTAYLTWCEQNKKLQTVDTFEEFPESRK